jgi:hypothetical protein
MTAQLSAMVEPWDAVQNVSWSTSNPAAVTVSGTGLVTAVGAPGSTATITATAVGGMTATCAVTVVSGNGVTVTFTGFGNETIDHTQNTVNDLSRSNGDSLTVQVQGSYSSYRWHMDGNEYSSGYEGEGNFYAGNLTVGIHHLTVTVVKDGVPYSKELTFRVVW